MSKKSRRVRQPAPRRDAPWLWIVAGAAVLLIVAGLGLWWRSSSAVPAEVQGDGAPNLVVDQTTIDEGYVQFDVPVRSAFTLTNAGNQPLRILDEPQVELVEGC